MAKAWLSNEKLRKKVAVIASILDIDTYFAGADAAESGYAFGTPPVLNIDTGSREDEQSLSATLV